jgi:uncharacterized protein YkwD
MRDRAHRCLLAFLLGTGVATVQPATRLMASQEQGSARQQAPNQEQEQRQKQDSPSQQATLKPVAASASDLAATNSSEGRFDAYSEQQLLVFANQSRRQAGAPPLTIDPGLSQAARIHALAMLKARQLSHQLDGEPSLPQRLAATTQLQLQAEGENVALDYDAEHGHLHLMLSTPHRANLLNPTYNVVGLAVIRDADRIFIVQDFGSALPKYSPQEVKERVAVAVNQTRRVAQRAALQERDLLGADDTACSMAQADKAVVPQDHKPAESLSIITYTSLHPEALPGAASSAVVDRNLRSFSVGACYARTPSYPTGVYWVVLALR